MPNSHVFISHSSQDDPFVRELRQALEALGIPTWVDSRELAGGAKLAPEIEQAIETAQRPKMSANVNGCQPVGKWRGG